MPFADLVSRLRVDLDQYDKDFAEAERRAKAAIERIERLQVNLRTGAGGGGGGGGVGRSAQTQQQRIDGVVKQHEKELAARDQLFRQTNQQNQQAEAERRRLEAARGAAERDEQRRVQSILREGTVAARSEQQQRAQGEKAVAAAVRETERDVRAERQKSLVALRQLANAERDALRGRLGRGEITREQFRAGSAGITRAERTGRTSGQFEFATQQISEFARGIDNASTLTGRLKQRFDDLGQHSLQTLTEQTKQFTSLLAGLAVGGAAAGLGFLVKTAIEYDAEYQKIKYGIAEVLSLTTQLTDAQGKLVEGPRQLRANLAESGKIYKYIIEQAKGTVLTTAELAANVERTIGFALRGGAKNPEEAVRTITRITNLAKVLGANQTREQSFEAKALLTGQFISRSRIGQALGLNAEEIKQARDSGKLIEFINEKLKGGADLVEKYKSSFTGITTTLRSGFLEVLRRISEQTFDRLTASLGIFGKDFDKYFTEERIRRIADALDRVGAQFFDAINRFVTGGGLEKLGNFFQFLTTHSGELVALFTAAKGLQGLSALGALLRNQNQPGALLSGTKAGQAAATFGSVEGAGGKVIAAAGAGALGYAIGTLINETAHNLLGTGRLEEEGRKQQDNARSLRANSPVFRRREAEDRFREAQQRVNDITFGNGGTPTGGNRAVRFARNFFDPGNVAEAFSGGRPRNVAGDEAAAEQAQRKVSGSLLRRRGEELKQAIIEEEQSRHKKEANEAEYIRTTRIAKQQNAQAERAFIARERAKLTDDKIAELKFTAEAEEQNIKKRVKSESIAADLIRQVRAKLVRDIHDLREKERIDTEKQLAELTGNRILSIKAELAERLKAIDDSDKTEAQKQKLNAAARTRANRDLRDEAGGRGLARREFAAGTRGNDLQQLALRNVRAFQDRARQIEIDGTLTAAQKKTEIERAYQQQRHQFEREFLDFARQQGRSALDLVKQKQEAERELARTREGLERQRFNLEKEHRRQERELVAEQANAELGLARAREDRALQARRVGTLGRIIPGILRRGPNGGFTPAREGGTEGTEGERQQLQERAEALLSQFGVQKTLTEQFSRTSGPRLGAALAEQKARELRDQLTQPGGGGLEELQGLLGKGGVAPGLAAGVRDLQTQAVGLANREAGIGDEEGRTGLQRKREDLDQPVKDASQRLQDLAEKIKDVQESYNQTIKELNTGFQDAIRSTKETLLRLGEAARTVAQDLNRNNITPDKNVAPVLSDLQRFSKPGVAGAAAANRLDSTRQIVFGPGSVIVNGVNGEQFVRQIQEQARTARVR